MCTSALDRAFLAQLVQDWSNLDLSALWRRDTCQRRRYHARSSPMDGTASDLHNCRLRSPKHNNTHHVYKCHGLSTAMDNQRVSVRYGK